MRKFFKINVNGANNEAVVRNVMGTANDPLSLTEEDNTTTPQLTRPNLPLNNVNNSRCRTTCISPTRPVRTIYKCYDCDGNMSDLKIRV